MNFADMTPAQKQELAKGIQLLVRRFGKAAQAKRVKPRIHQTPQGWAVYRAVGVYGSYEEALQSIKETK